MAHDYPGNIRELENILEHAFVLCPEGIIRTRNLPGYLVSRTRDEEESPADGDPVKAAEIKTILDALKRNRYNRKAAAVDLGMHKSTLFRKIHKLGIRLPDADGRSTLPSDP